ncbi:MAG: response regulator [Gammaproteobacteria bacterium]|jgi:two-component system response regulator FixJ|nr:response regulator [Gammaproteobacteria bacterium]MDH3887714.1 response regulator [Gammaproteobacteria bacterium]MDH3935403.1 response regulator [Gammaproteobacteria bacterium]MDH3970556.1 response regulator [Gammaproteobacteria bacterium]MDH3985073.1 response regulator [Gammaproteobacteria bacterium]
MDTGQTVYIVDDEEPVRKALRFLTKSVGLKSESFETAAALLDALERLGPGCLLLDVCMPDMGGLELQLALRERKVEIPVIIVTGHADIAIAVQAMKNGASDFVEKPIDSEDLLERIQQCLSNEARSRCNVESRKQAVERLASLSRRERQVMEGLVAGKRNKQIADELFISFRTVELHRASIKVKLKAKSLSDIVRIALLAENLDQ